MKINEFFQKNKPEFQSKIEELNYLQQFYPALEKFSAMKGLKFEVYQAYNRMFVRSNQDDKIKNRFDFLPIDIENKFLISHYSDKKIPFFGSKNIKEMKSFLIYLAPKFFGSFIIPYFEVENQKIFHNQFINYGQRRFQMLGYNPNNLNNTLYSSLKEIGYNSDLVTQIMDFCSQCRLKDESQFLSEYNYQ